MLNFFEKLLDQYPFRKKLIISFFLISFVPMLILGTLSLVQNFQLFNFGKEEILKNDVNQFKSIYEDRVDRLDYSFNTLMFDNSIISFFEVPPQSYYELYQKLNDSFNPAYLNLRINNPLIERVSFFSDTPSQFFGSYIKSVDEAPKNLEKITQPGDPLWFNYQGNIYLGGIFPTIKNQKLYALIEVNLAEFFKNNLHDSSEYYIGVSAATGEKLYHSKHGKMSVKETYQTPLKDSNLILSVFFSSQKLNRFTLQIVLLWGGLVTLSFICSISLSYYFSNKIVKVIDVLKNKVQLISKDNLDVDFSSDNKDEISELGLLISDMMLRIKTLLRNVKDAKIEVRENEYKALTNQINSHFLYNTLSLLNWQAIISNQPEMSQTIRLLSDYYRTTLNQGKSVTDFQSELHNIKSYLELQKFILPGRFNYEIYIHKDLKSCLTINLLFQPIVENAIEHGFKNLNSGGFIWIHVDKVKENRLRILIVDNGQGMSKEKLDAVFNDNNQSFGLKNIKSRIAFYYHQRATFNIYSEEGKGTTVNITLPITYKKDDLSNL